MPKLICKKKAYTGSQEKYKGKTFTEFYVVADNGTEIQIKPCFDNDYRSLEILAERVK